MGMVFLGRDPALDRPVAIKIIRPELATAAAAERFLREARILASLSHPNVIPVHRAGEAGGFSYYVMDYLAAETLADRIARGPLPAAEVLALGSDLLAALDAAHRQGILHRDVKPANLFLLEGRAVLGDFGIAKSATDGGVTLTVPGSAIGTPDYMAPEQATGQQVTAAADLYSAGLVLYEALTGRRWPSFEEPESADWSGVPRALVPVLKRALALRAAARWPDAASFRRALARASGPAHARRVLLSLAGLAMAAAAVALWFAGPWRAGTSSAASLQVVIRPFRVIPAGAPAWLGDSLGWMLHRALGASADFHVRLVRGDLAADTTASLLLDGLATVRGDSLALVVTPAPGTRGSGAFRAETTGTVSEWPRAAGDLAYEVLWRIWRDAHGPLARDLPRAALPRTTEGLRAFLAAEQLFAHAQWQAAYEAYLRAAEQDRTCLLCDVRLTDVGRWLGIEADTARTHRYRAARDSFPPHYRQLIDASFLPEPERLALLRDLTDRSRPWGFGRFVAGDEVFHRGPFAGERRAAAKSLLEQAAVLRPDFAPIWEHLAWVDIAEGDSAGAAAALARYGETAAPSDTMSAAIGALISGAFQWRFAAEPYAVAFSEGILAQPAIAAFSDLATAPSQLLTFEVPRATIWMGEQFARGRPHAGLEVTGLLAQVHGLIATGRVDSALAVAGRLAAGASEPAIALFAAELPAALTLVDSADAAVRWPPLAAALDPIASGATGAPPLLRARAAWMLALLAHRARRGPDVQRYRDILAATEPAGGPLRAFVDVVVGLAAHGVPSAALRRSAPLVLLDSSSRGGDPFYRMLLHLSRAEWQLGARLADEAVRELRWHENNDFTRNAGLKPQSVEVDYAFGTLAHWRRARLLESLGSAYRDEACANYAAVARHWREGDAPFAARADSAAQHLRALGCPAAR